MKLWILRPIRDWDPWYDRCFGMVVRASQSALAREAAASEACDEGASVWLDSTKTTCDELTTDGEPGVVIMDVHSA